MLPLALAVALAVAGAVVLVAFLGYVIERSSRGLDDRM